MRTVASERSAPSEWRLRTALARLVDERLVVEVYGCALPVVLARWSRASAEAIVGYEGAFAGGQDVGQLVHHNAARIARRYRSRLVSRLATDFALQAAQALEY